MNFHCRKQQVIVLTELNSWWPRLSDDHLSKPTSQCSWDQGLCNSYTEALLTRTNRKPNSHSNWKTSQHFRVATVRIQFCFGVFMPWQQLRSKEGGWLSWAAAYRRCRLWDTESHRFDIGAPPYRIEQGAMEWGRPNHSWLKLTLLYQLLLLLFYVVCCHFAFQQHLMSYQNGYLPTWGSVHSWRLYRATLLGDQAASTMIRRDGWIEYPVLVGCGTQISWVWDLVTLKQWLKTWYLLPPSLALSQIRIGQGAEEWGRSNAHEWNFLG